jgi:membrane-bound serine protease (ClpP class)
MRTLMSFSNESTPELKIKTLPRSRMKKSMEPHRLKSVVPEWTFLRQSAFAFGFGEVIRRIRRPRTSSDISTKQKNLFRISASEAGEISPPADLHTAKTRGLLRSRMIFLSVLFLCFSYSPAGNSQEIQANKFLILTIDNKTINPVIANYLTTGIELAENNHYAGVIIVMDTPGGLLESTRLIVKKIMNASLPVITYIAPSGSRAGSAGVFITLAAHVAAMAPSTNIGAAHPVTLGNEKPNDRSLKKAIEDLTAALQTQKAKKKSLGQPNPEKQNNLSEDALEDKVLNDTVAWITTIAKNRNRNVDWAKRAVLESVSVPEKEALDKKIIDLIAKDIPELLRMLDGATLSFPDRTFQLHTKNPQLIYLNLSLRQNTLSSLIEPNIAYILMLIGFLGLFVEITHPGVILPGILGVICLITAFYAFAMLPVHFAGFLLIGLAIILFIAEALTVISFGVLTIAGAISMLLGSLMLIDSSFSGLRISLTIILSFTFAVAAVVIFLATNVVKAHRKKITTGAEALAGQTGLAHTDIDGQGQVFVAGEIWTAVNQTGQLIKKGEKIKVLGVDKAKLLVGKY